MPQLKKEKILELIEKEPNNAQHYQDLGKFYVREKDFELAEKYFHKSLELDSEDAWTYMYLGNLCHHKNMIEESLKYYEFAAKLMPDVAAPFWCIAEMHEKLKQYNLADSYFEKAVKIDPNNEDAVRKLKEWKDWYVKH